MAFGEKFKEKQIKKENTEVFDRRCKMLQGLLGGYFDSIDTKNRPTALDFNGLNPEAAEKEFLGWISKTLNISPDKIKSDDKETYRKLNQAFSMGKDFLRQMLKYSDRELEFGPKELNNKKEVFDLLEGTKMVKNASAKTKGLDNSVAYCRLAKATHIAYEVLKNDAELLRDLTKSFGTQMTSEAGENFYAPLTVSGKKEGAQDFFIQDSSFVTGTVEMRSKDFWKLMLRFLNRPEANAKKALEDGVAARIIVDREKAVDLVPILSNWLLMSMHARELSIENRSFFSEEQIQKVEEVIRKDSAKQNLAIINSPIPNQVSAGSFSALVIKGRVPNRSLVSEDTSQNVRQFEMMVVTPDNTNDTAHNPGNHHVYDMKKVLMARTRLDGYCPVEVFESLLNETSHKTGIPKEDIRKWLLEPMDGKKAPIEEVNINNKRVYVSRPVIERWHSFEFVEDYIFEQL